ncbi:hypothetical protein [Trichococcus shcherbakoviae]|uniref:hypothetical protein n=1 Tax=Trichococcus shcherbakoviae TaxID=2094020 RepID=UPI002AA838C5|nr:hypothetical protein [Trichococcus shcherbakoviae]
MAEQNNLLSVLEHLATAIGANSDMARLAAVNSRSAKEAAEASQLSVESHAKQLASAGGKVISGTPTGTQNARTMTAMLAGFSEPPKSPPVATGGGHFDGDDDDSRPKRRRKRRSAKTASESASILTGGNGPSSPVMPISEEELDDDRPKRRRKQRSQRRRQRGSVSQAVKELQEPTPPPVQQPRDRRQSTAKDVAGSAWRLAKNVGRELLRLPGSSTNPIMAEEVGTQKAKSIQPPPLPGVRGMVGRAGGWIHKIGSVWGGRVGGALMQIGGAAARFGGVAVAAGAGGASGAATGGGAVAAIGAALSNPVTATVAAVAAMGLSAIAVTKTMHSLAESVTENQREMRRYSASIATAFARLDLQRLQLDVQTARNTGGTASTLTGATQMMEKSLQPMREDWQNTKNILTIPLAAGVNLVGKAYSLMTKWNPLFQMLRFLGKDKNENVGPPFIAALQTAFMDHRKDKEPANKKPRERSDK